MTARTRTMRFVPQGILCGLHADLKAKLSAAEPMREAAHLKRKVVSHLRSIQKRPARIRSYFKAEPIRYAA